MICNQYTIFCEQKKEMDMAVFLLPDIVAKELKSKNPDEYQILEKNDLKELTILKNILSFSIYFLLNYNIILICC